MGIYYNFSAFKNSKDCENNKIDFACQSSTRNLKLSEFAQLNHRTKDIMLTATVAYIITHKNCCVGFNYDCANDREAYDAAEQHYSTLKASRYADIYNKSDKHFYIVCDEKKQFVDYAKYQDAMKDDSTALDIVPFLFNQDMCRNNGQELPNFYQKSVYVVYDKTEIHQDYTDVTEMFI